MRRESGDESFRLGVGRRELTTGPSRIQRITAAVRARTPAYAERDEPFWEAAVALVL